jgi:uncharacterized protein YndB with AHSA1/START domain
VRPAMLPIAAAIFMCALFVPGTPPAADDPLVNEAVIDGPADEIWRLITTKAGLESCAVPHVQIDLRTGGLLRTNHNPNGKIGDGMTVTNRFLAVKPKRMVSLQVAETPTAIPFADALLGTWYQVSLIPLPDGRTRIRCEGRGFAEGPMGYAARAFVDKCNALGLEDLKKVFANRKAAPQPSPKHS